MGNPNNLPKPDAEARRLEMWNLRVNGKSCREIGKMMGCSHQLVHKNVKATMAELQEQRLDIAEKYVEKELKILDDLVYSLKAKADGGDAQASDVLLRALNRRSKYLGLDKPIKTEVDVSESLATLLVKGLKKDE